MASLSDAELRNAFEMACRVAKELARRLFHRGSDSEFDPIVDSLLDLHEKLNP